MSIRITKKRSLIKVALGDMRERIELYKRDITSPVFNSAKFTEKYTLIRKVWSMVETTQGKDGFADVSSVNGKTHEFSIRYLSGITSETRIKWRDNYYQILNVINPEERKQFLILECKVLGDVDLEANK